MLCLATTILVAMPLIAAPASLSEPVGTTRSSPVELTPAEWAWLEAHPEIRLAAYANYPPAQFIDEHGRHAGLAADYVHLIEQMLGIRGGKLVNGRWICD